MWGCNHYGSGPHNRLQALPAEDYPEEAVHYRRKPLPMNHGHSKESIEIIDHGEKRYPALDASPLWEVSFLNIRQDSLDETLDYIRKTTLQCAVEDLALIYRDGKSHSAFYIFENKTAYLIIDGLENWKHWSGKTIALWKKFEKQTLETIAYTLGHIKDVAEDILGYPPDWDNV